MSRWLSFLALAAIAAALLLAACGDDDSTAATSPPTKTTVAAANGAAGGPSSGGTTDPCALVTASELAGFLGGEPFNVQPGGGGCSYVGSGGAAYDTVQLNLSAQKKDLFESVKKNAKGTTDVSGVGEEAYYTSSSDHLVTLYLYKNGTSVLVSLDTEGDSAAASKTPVSTRVDAIQKIGKAIAGRL